MNDYELPDDAVVPIATRKERLGLRRYAHPCCTQIEVGGGKRRERKPSIRAMIKAAEQAGKIVTAVTTPEGVTLTFGEPSTAQHGSWDDLETGTRQ